MTRFSRAVSTTSLVTNAGALISRIRSTCVSSRFTNRKLPPVIRMIEAAAIESIASPGSLTPGGITYSVYWLGRNCLAIATGRRQPNGPWGPPCPASTILAGLCYASDMGGNERHSSDWPRLASSVMTKSLPCCRRHFAPEAEVKSTLRRRTSLHRAANRLSGVRADRGRDRDVGKWADRRAPLHRR
jgi:hypothetical protein